MLSPKNKTQKFYGFLINFLMKLKILIFSKDPTSVIVHFFNKSYGQKWFSIRFNIYLQNFRGSDR